MSNKAKPNQVFGYVSALIGKLPWAYPAYRHSDGAMACRACPLVTLGTRYGGSVMAEPRDRGSAARYALLCGAGEDVSFDLALQKSFGMSCIIVDPTPRAVAHWATLVERFAGGQPMAVNGSPTENYDVAGVDFEKMCIIRLPFGRRMRILNSGLPKTRAMFLIPQRISRIPVTMCSFREKPWQSFRPSRRARSNSSSWMWRGSALRSSAG